MFEYKQQVIKQLQVKGWSYEVAAETVEAYDLYHYRRKYSADELADLIYHYENET